MTNLALKIEKFAVYIIIIYMATMTGLYFHMDSRINVLQTLQNKTFEKFALKEEGHDEILSEMQVEVNNLATSVKELNSDVKQQLNGLTNLLLKNSTLLRENNSDINNITNPSNKKSLPVNSKEDSSSNN